VRTIGPGLHKLDRRLHAASADKRDARIVRADGLVQAD
jgi:hypothetical protein